MPRPRLHRRIRHKLRSRFFKPQGIPMHNIDEINLTAEEGEALRLKNIEKLGQIECAKRMNTSQSTFQRIITSAYAKVSDAIINGKAISVEK